jgi:hypothetical protein
MVTTNNNSVVNNKEFSYCTVRVSDCTVLDGVN